jgi:hypothetical protein
MLPVSISRSGFAFIASACLMSQVALGAEGEDGAVPFSFSDIRIGYATAIAPTVTEHISSGGSTARNEWDAGDSYGQRFELSYQRGTSTDGVGRICGAQLSVGNYTLGDTDSFGDVTEITYSTAMLDLSYGIQCGITESGGLRGHVELAPFVGLGAGWLAVAGERKYQFAYEAGVKAGAYLSERDYLLGVTLAGVFGMSKGTYDIGSGSESELELRTHGVRIGFEAGYRF